MGIPLQSARPSADVIGVAELPELRTIANTATTQPPRRSALRAGGAKAPGRVNTDSIGWYLGTIGRVPLLTPAEEIELAHHVQQGKALHELAPETLSAPSINSTPAWATNFPLTPIGGSGRA